MSLTRRPEDSVPMVDELSRKRKTPPSGEAEAAGEMRHSSNLGMPSIHDLRAYQRAISESKPGSKDEASSQESRKKPKQPKLEVRPTLEDLLQAVAAAKTSEKANESSSSAEPMSDVDPANSASLSSSSSHSSHSSNARSAPLSSPSIPQYQADMADFSHSSSASSPASLSRLRRREQREAKKSSETSHVEINRLDKYPEVQRRAEEAGRGFFLAPRSAVNAKDKKEVDEREVFFYSVLERFEILTSEQGILLLAANQLVQGKSLSEYVSHSGNTLTFEGSFPGITQFCDKILLSLLQEGAALTIYTVKDKWNELQETQDAAEGKGRIPCLSLVNEKKLLKIAKPLETIFSHWETITLKCKKKSRCWINIDSAFEEARSILARESKQKDSDSIVSSSGLFKEVAQGSAANPEFPAPSSSSHSRAT